MEDEKFQTLQNELVQMGQADQAMRRSDIWDASLDVKHTLRMKQIIEDIG